MEAILLVIAILGVGAITPGPNNFMVMTAGARGGFSAACPVIVGVMVGGLVLLALAWSGVAATLSNAPGLRLLLTTAGAAYLVWHGGGMIWKSRDLSVSQRERALPDRWLGVAAFQLLNPKAWVLLMTAATVMSGSIAGLRGFMMLAAIYLLRSAISLSVWAVLGSALGGALGARGSRHWFERLMGGLLVALAALLVVGESIGSGAWTESTGVVHGPATSNTGAGPPASQFQLRSGEP
jgi:threonine/homoserine/homoserine lactone efflux protein